ncbi:anti-sigma factor family protein [Streptomyces sp. NPDC092296]|uniref:anti-sigma factor family protein n=1 Tax=Streptomyces sp. NPDC092296 TaxID=3366012 RepID=UPI003810A9F1
MTPITPGSGPTEPPLPDPAGSADPADHPAVEEISDLTEDLLTPAAAETVRAHLAGCTECTDTRDALLEIRALLGRTEAPPLPADIADRIDAALAAEAAAPTDTAAAEPGPPVRDRTRPGGGPGLATGPGRGPRRRRTGRLLLATAAVAAAIGLGGVLIHTLQTDHVRSTSALKDAAGATAAPQRAFTARQPHGVASDQLAAQSRGTGTAYTEQGLDSQIGRLMSGPGARPANGTATAPLPDCVLQATGRPADQPLATDLGTFQGGPVAVVVYAAAQPVGALDVFLVDPDCEQVAPADPGTVRLHRTLTPAP